MPLFSKFSAP